MRLVSYGPGERVAGRYVVESLLGQGGMGVVLRARDEKLERSVALKVLPARALGDGIARARMLREARAAAGLDHPNIVHVYDVGETDDGGAFIAMELVRGRSLRAMATAGDLDVATIAQVIRDAGATLASAHRGGFVHRDVKPDNLMVRDDGRVVVLDFGLAKPVEAAVGAMALTDDGSIVGTPAYLSPEQARGEALSGASDQFSLAVTAFELLTGRLPWSGATPMAVLASIVSDEPLHASSLVASLPHALDVVLDRALAKKSSDRHGDCEAFGGALFEALRSVPGDVALLETAAAPTPTALGRTTARVRRPAGVRASIAVVATLGAMSFLAWELVARSTVQPAVAATVPLAMLGEGDVLACPILEVERAGAETGWLGAAVASAICDRAVWRLGGRPERTRIPAELLRLAPTPSSDSSPDAYCASDARERALAEARRVGTAVLIGTIENEEHGLSVRVHVVRSDGSESATVETTGTVREIAVHVTDAWVQAGVLPAAMPIDDEVARWTLMSDPSVALALYDVGTAERAMDDDAEPCAVLRHDAAHIDPLVLSTLGSCDGLSHAPLDDRSSAPRLAMTAQHAAAPDASLIAALESARATETSELGRGYLAAAEAYALRATEHERAIETMWIATRSRRRDGAVIWGSLAFWSFQPSVTQAFSEWVPGDADAWGTRALALLPRDPMRLELLRRAHAVAPRNTSAAADLALAELATGDVGSARAVSAEIADLDADHRFVSEMISILATSAEGRIAVASTRARALIATIEHVVTYLRQDYYLIEWVVELAVLTGDRSLADAYLERAMLDQATQTGVADNRDAHDRYVSMLAAVATPAMGRAALDGLPSLDDMVLGMRALLAGQREDAARLLRREVSSSHLATLPALAAIAAPALDAEGADAVVALADARLADEHGLFHGVGTVDVRIARRHAAHAEVELARDAAQRVVDALSSVDVDIPLLAEMRRIAATGR